jgi:hypothetical protein
MEWHEAIEQLREHLVHISTPRGSGTGWLVSTSSTTDLCAIATAAHVVAYAHFWKSRSESFIRTPESQSCFAQEIGLFIYTVSWIPPPSL